MKILHVIDPRSFLQDIQDTEAGPLQVRPYGIWANPKTDKLRVVGRVGNEEDALAGFIFEDDKVTAVFPGTWLNSVSECYVLGIQDKETAILFRKGHAGWHQFIDYPTPKLISTLPKGEAIHSYPITTCIARDVNQEGIFVGHFAQEWQSNPNVPRFAFYKELGSNPQILKPLCGYEFSEAQSISSDGIIVGASFNLLPSGVKDRMPTIWRLHDKSYQRELIPGCGGGYFHHISPDGQYVVGASVDIDGSDQPIFVRLGNGAGNPDIIMKPQPTLDQPGVLWGVNNSGRGVGFVTLDDESTSLLIYREGQFLVVSELGGYRLEYAESISSTGVIAAYGTKVGDEHLGRFGLIIALN